MTMQLAVVMEVQILVFEGTLYLFLANKLFNLTFSSKYILRVSLVMVLRDGRRYLGAATLQKCLKPGFSTTEKRQFIKNNHFYGCSSTSFLTNLAAT